MNFQRRTAHLLSALPAVFTGRNPIPSAVRGPVSALRRRPPRPLHPAGRAALSTHPSSSAPDAAGLSFTSQSPAASAAAAASHHQAAITTTVSRCRPETARGKHVFEVAGYSLHKGIGVGNFIQSATFSVGGYDWCIRFYPDGNDECEDEDEDEDEEEDEDEDEDDDDDDDACVEDERYVSAFVVLLSEGVEVRAFYDLSLVKPATVPSPAAECSDEKKSSVFNGEGSSSGYERFIRRCDLEESYFLQNDGLLIECDLTVITGTPVTESETIHDVTVPPSDLLDDYRKFVEASKRADVMFKVKGEVFHAHKFVLAMRTPVFEAELYGKQGENKLQCITIEDMEPSVFKALLHFIYTDSLPAMDGLGGDEKEELVKGLLAAADRCSMESMKLMCESILCKRLSVENVAGTLALAEQHNCSQLKDACIIYINSLGRIEDVVASQGHKDLKKSNPAIIVELWEKSAMSSKI